MALRTSIDKYPSLVVADTVFKINVIPAVNSLPRFVSALERYHILLKTTVAKSWSY